MGLCQGRNCQRQVAAVLARRHSLRVSEVLSLTARPPARPLPMKVLADEAVPDEGLSDRRGSCKLTKLANPEQCLRGR